MRIVWVVLILVASLFAESVAGLKWTAPTGWKAEEGTRPMRAATYSIAPTAGDTANAECVVYFFGNGQGGSVEANLDRWKGQVLGPDGKPAEAKIAKKTIHGLAVTTIDTSGDYGGMGGADDGVEIGEEQLSSAGRDCGGTGRKCVPEAYRAGEDDRGQSSGVRAVAELV